MKRIVVLLIPVLMLIGVSAVAHEGHEHGKTATRPVTLTGEVIDMTCYLQHPANATGVDHAKCAKSCVAKGLPIGFLADNGSVYLLIGNDHEPIAAKVAGHVGARSTITGAVAENNGVKAIELASIDAAPAAAKANAPAATKTSSKTVTWYTCEMDPDVHVDHPGDCPKCGMTLVPEKKQ
jgi:hypothetical protein